MMLMNSKNSTSNSPKVDDSMKALILEYMTQSNNGNHAEAEVILHKINTMRKLTNDS